jgi:hypothetical protein
VQGVHRMGQFDIPELHSKGSFEHAFQRISIRMVTQDLRKQVLASSVEFDRGA